MTDVIAHDIRNPLNNILLSTAQFKMETLPDREDTAFYIDIIERSCDRIGQLMTEILAVMQPQAISPGTFDLVALAEELLGEYEERFRISNIHCRLPGIPTLAAVFDRAQVKSALRQLIDNALDAAGKGGELALEIQESEGACSISVTDSGSGIAPDVLPYIYIPFFTTRDRHKGLGLTLAKNIAEAHQGRIEAETGAQGSRFTLVLPR